MSLPDIQNNHDDRGIYIECAGITNFNMPIHLTCKESEESMNTVASVECFVDLESNIKGINMSRLPIGVTNNNEISLDIIAKYAKEICIQSNANRCELKYKFPYFITKNAPVTKIPGVVSYDVELKTVYYADSNVNHKYIKVTAIASTCCPCSKEISNYNAHNQKCYITIEVGTDEFIWIEDLIKIAEESASCEIFSILKRPDEKFVTEAMYDSPRFVEDVVREACVRLTKRYIDKLSSYTIEAIADESIHMHKAIAKINYIKTEL